MMESAWEGAEGRQGDTGSQPAQFRGPTQTHLMEESGPQCGKEMQSGVGEGLSTDGWLAQGELLFACFSLNTVPCTSPEVRGQQRHLVPARSTAGTRPAAVAVAASTRHQPRLHTDNRGGTPPPPRKRQVPRGRC